VIDIDIIAYGRLVVDEEGLTLPHPHAAEREFVMTPLREIAPGEAQWLAERAGR
jgi:2-amino-4-hydroxy-6-hydroxymethyldihydropteridine diphosphokinase